MAFGTGAPYRRTSGGWKDYNDDANIWVKTGGQWKQPTNSEDLPQIWSKVGGQWQQIYYKKEPYVEVEPPEEEIDNDRLTLFRSNYNSVVNGKVGQGWFDGLDYHGTKTVVHPYHNHGCLGLSGSQFPGIKIDVLTDVRISYYRTASGYYGSSTTISFKRWNVKKYFHMVVRNTKAEGTSFSDSELNAGKVYTGTQPEIIASHTIPASGADTVVQAVLDHKDEFRQMFNDHHWMYVSNNEGEDRSDPRKYPGYSSPAYFSRHYMRAIDFKLKMKFTTTATKASFVRDERISPFSTKSDDNYHQMYIYEDESGMMLGDILERRDRLGIPDIDIVGWSNELPIFSMDNRFEDGMFVVAFPNLYDNVNCKVFIEYDDIDADKKIKKEMFIHPLKGVHFAVVPDSVDIVYVSVINTETLTMLYDSHFYRYLPRNF